MAADNTAKDQTSYSQYYLLKPTTRHRTTWEFIQFCGFVAYAGDIAALE